MAASFSDGWSWCDRCQALFYGVPGAMGKCPAGGVHDSQRSPNYFMLFVDEDPSGLNQQPFWRMCENCRVLFYGPGAASSSCPAGGQHIASGSSNFAVQFDDGSSPTNEPGFRWCKNCQALFYGPGAASSSCPAGAGWRHDPSESGNYDLPFVGVPWIGTYAFDGKLRAEGSNYTVNGQVDVFTKHSDGTLFYHERVMATENPSAPGGWTAGTNTTSDPGAYNGYVQAHDLASDKWSPKLPITIWVPFE
jgi:hypothetical protein